MRAGIWTLLLLSLIALPLRAGDLDKKGKPDAAAIRELQTITLFYKVTDAGLQLNWSPTNAEPSGGIKVSCSESDPEPLYPYDGYVVWLRGTGHGSCVVPLKKAASAKPRYYRICSVKQDNHKEYVALSNVIVVPPLESAPAGADEPKNKSKVKKEQAKKNDNDKQTKTVEKASKAKGTGTAKGGGEPASEKKTAKATDQGAEGTIKFPEAKALKRPGGAVVVGYKDTDVAGIPEKFIEKAKQDFRVWYGHTSHGSQITSGMKAMNQPPFAYNPDGSGGALAYTETGGDLGHNGDDKWEQATRRYLDGGGKANVIMWSWCGGMSDNTPEGVARYLELMDKLEADYPGRIFIYMTGHLDGSGEGGNLNRMNNLIRDFCKKNGKVLFDFAEIESYDPDGNYFLDKRADDGCNWREGAVRGNWASDWLAKHPDHGISLPASAAHTQPLNGALKGRAFWALLAKLAGWND